MENDEKTLIKICAELRDDNTVVCYDEIHINSKWEMLAAAHGLAKLLLRDDMLWAFTMQSIRDLAVSDEEDNDFSIDFNDILKNLDKNKN